MPVVRRRLGRGSSAIRRLEGVICGREPSVPMFKWRCPMPDVIFERRDNGVALITLNRPDSLNAMGGDLMPLLAQHLEESRWDNPVRCVVLTGAGRAFCAGGDVKNMAAQGAR